MQDKIKYYEDLSEELNKMEERGEKAAAAKRARKIAKKARQGGDEAFALFFEGEAFAFKGKYEKAEPLEFKAVERAPNVVLLLSGYGTILLWLDRNEEALVFFNKALSIEPENLGALEGKGVSLSKLDQDEEALEFFDKALLLDPENIYSLTQKGVSLSGLGREKEALPLLDKVLAIEPRNYYALAQKGVSLSKLGQEDEALAIFDKAIALEPKNVSALVHKGIMLCALKRFLDALSCFKEATQHKELDHNTLLWQADAYIALEQLDEAEAAVNKSLQKLKRKGLSTKVADYLLRSILQKKAERDSGVVGTDGLEEPMRKVLAHFGPEILQKHVDIIEAKEKDFQKFLDTTAPSQKITEAPAAGFLSVLRKWNSYTPIMSLDVGESKGGGYFLYLGGQGIVVDPGFDFIRNFFREGFKVADVDHVFITHAHVDHMADLEPLFSLLYEASEKDKDKKIDLFLNLGAMKKLSSWLNLKERYIRCIHVLEAGQRMEVDGFTVTATRAKHNELLDSTYSLGYVFQAGDVKVGFTGDTGWKMDGSIAEPFVGCQVLAAHLGGIMRNEIDPGTVEERLYPNHLGLLGMSGLLDKVRPNLCVVSEFGEELGGDLRLKVAEGLSQALEVSCVSADVGTEIAFSDADPAVPKVRCAVCGQFMVEWQPQIIHSTIIYSCPACSKGPLCHDLQERYAKGGERWTLWEDVRRRLTQ